MLTYIQIRYYCRHLSSLDLSPAQSKYVLLDETASFSTAATRAFRISDEFRSLPRAIQTCTP